MGEVYDWNDENNKEENTKKLGNLILEAGLIPNLKSLKQVHVSTPVTYNIHAYPLVFFVCFGILVVMLHVLFNRAERDKISIFETLQISSGTFGSISSFFIVMSIIGGGLYFLIMSIAMWVLVPGKVVK